MQDPMLVSAFLMGLLGGPHCLAMCGAACIGIGKLNPNRSHLNMGIFQLGRVLGYASLGAIVAGSVQFFAWIGAQTPVVRPLWTALHMTAFFVGLLLILKGRQPRWIDGWAQRVWRSIKPRFQALGAKAPMIMGVGWAFMPCGLLYSALLVASLSGSLLNGGLTMAAFAMGSGLFLTIGPWAFMRLGFQSGHWGVRLGGGALAMTSAWAMWNGLTNPTGLWC